jgi:hypothetical protein
MSQRRSEQPAEDRGLYDARQTEAYDASGVDVTLIDWMLSLSPKERLDALYDAASSTARLSERGGTD